MAEIARKVPWSRIGAESAAIVASILLAFSIDAWHEQRGERALEVEYLQRIGGELRDARTELESLVLDVNASKHFATEISEFFDGRLVAGEHDRLVIAVYNFGSDTLRAKWDMSTFDDLVSTGRLRLISDFQVRHAIQHAYAQLQTLPPMLAPYREEYKAVLGGWIPLSMGQQIRDACPRNGAEVACSDLDLEDETVRSIVEQIDTREALLAFRLREQALWILSEITDDVMTTVDQALARLEQ